MIPRAAAIDSRRPGSHATANRRAGSCGLLLDTLSANAFFFAIDDVGSGTHNMVVQARIDSGGGSQQGSFTARGCVGLGALTVEEHRFVKGEDIVLE